MKTYHVTATIVISYQNPNAGRLRRHKSECSAIVHAESEPDALSEAQPWLFEQAEANADMPAGWIEDGDIMPGSVTVTEITERDKLLALGRDIAPLLPGLELEG
jgi:hypothetical protein